MSSRPPLPGEGPIATEVTPADSEAPRLLRIWTGMEPKVLWRGVTPLCHLPQLNLKSKV
jgi:hypothetical protein